MADLITFAVPVADTGEVRKWTIRGADVRDLYEIHPGLVIVNGHLTVAAFTHQIINAINKKAPHFDLRPGEEQLAEALAAARERWEEARNRAALAPQTVTIQDIITQRVRPESEH